MFFRYQLTWVVPDKEPLNWLLLQTEDLSVVCFD